MARSSPPERLRIDPAQLVVRVDTPGGPGGQHANRARTRVTVELDLRTAVGLDDETRERLRAALGDVVRSSSSASRSQADNRRAAEERLTHRIAAALRPAATRHATRPTRSSVERRIDEKKRRSSIKRQRRARDD